MNQLKQKSPRFRLSRQGAALMEVLIAILAMSVGVMSVMTLFPLAILRSVQGHHLTVGTGVRLNAESELNTNPVIWLDPNRNGNIAEHASEVFFIDPYGLVQTQPNKLGSTLNRYSAGFNSRQSATAAAVYDGNWIDQVEEIENPVQSLSGVTNVTLAATTNLSSVPLTPDIESRILFFDATGKISRSRTITNITSPLSSPVVNWAAGQPLTMNNITKVRVSTRDGQYSWLITARRHDIGNKRLADIYVTVFFRREFPAGGDPTFTNGGNPVFRSGQLTATISGYTNPPEVKSGSYVLDSLNGYWYRINNLKDNGGSIDVTLSDTPTNNGNEAVFMRGIVDNYYIGTKSFP